MIQHQALQELTLLTQCDQLEIAQIADVVLAVSAQWQDHAVDLEDYQSIIARNLSLLVQLPPSSHREIALRALEDLI